MRNDSTHPPTAQRAHRADRHAVKRNVKATQVVASARNLTSPVPVPLGVGRALTVKRDSPTGIKWLLPMKRKSS